jgi:hypothetical protein
MFKLLDMESGLKVESASVPCRGPAEIEDVPPFAVTAEDIIISKLKWSKMSGSRRQIENVSGMLKVRWAVA